MTMPMGGGGDGSRSDPPASPARYRSGFRNRFVRGHRSRWLLVSLLSFWLALTTLALPLAAAYADANSLSSYGVTANAWAIQPDIVNDSFQNVPAADQAASYVYVAMDSGPSAHAKASYFFPGTAINAVPNTQGVAFSVPTGVDARYPGNGADSGQVTGFNDGIATQATGGQQSTRASEGYALAQAAVASYQFAPTIPAVPTAPNSPAGVPGVPSLPSPPALPTVASGGSPATATPAAIPTASSGPSPTATPCPILNICLPGSSKSSHGGVNAAPGSVQAPQGLQPAILPDAIEQRLTAALKAAQLSNPGLQSLAGGSLAAPNPTLPYLGADISSQAETRATDAGVTIAIVTHAQHVELLQGLITFGSIESILQATAPGSSSVKGSGTITTTITGAAIAGIPVTVDQNGVTVNDQNVSAAQAQTLTDQLNSALKQADIHISLTKSVITTDVGMWQGAGSGIEVTADPSTPSLNLPPPANGIPSTHVSISIAQVSASIYATPPDASSSDTGGSSYSGAGSGSGSGGGGGGFCFFCGGGGGGNGGGSGSSTTSSPDAPTHGASSFTLPGGLHGLPVLALVFVVQGLSTAAVAATAGFTNAEEAIGAPSAEEETQ